MAGCRGSKARTCWLLAQGAKGLTTGVGRSSAQMQIVARIGHRLGIPTNCHTAQGEKTPEMKDALNHKAKVFQHKAGYGSVVANRAYEDARHRTDWVCIPPGMAHPTTIQCVRLQVRNVAETPGIKRIVICLGGGANAAGLLWGLRDYKLDIPVLGIRVGGDPVKHIERFGPPYWQNRLKIVQSKYAYTTALDGKSLFGVPLDPYYEAKCMEHLQAGDLFWIIGRRVP